MKLERWIVTRIVEEKFESYGETKQEALNNCNSYGNPYSVIVKKESVNRAPKGER